MLTRGVRAAWSTRSSSAATIATATFVLWMSSIVWTHGAGSQPDCWRVTEDSQWPAAVFHISTAQSSRAPSLGSARCV